MASGIIKQVVFPVVRTNTFNLRKIPNSKITILETHKIIKPMHSLMQKIKMLTSKKSA